MATHIVQPISHTNGRRINWNDKANRVTVKAPCLYVDAPTEKQAIELAKEKSGLGRFPNWSFHHKGTLGPQKHDIGESRRRKRRSDDDSKSKSKKGPQVVLPDGTMVR